MLRWFQALMPREDKFFDMFARHAETIAKGSVSLRGVLQGGPDVAKHAAEVSTQEHMADEIAREVMLAVRRTFITPFDREDIHSLTKELDDVVDMLFTITSRMKVYKINGVDKNLVEFAAVIEKSVRAVGCAVEAMRNIKNLKAVSDACVEVNSFENIGDALRDKVLAELFETAKDPITVIKLKEIYQDAETVLDICEDVAHVVESILVKQA